MFSSKNFFFFKGHYFPSTSHLPALHSFDTFSLFKSRYILSCKQRTYVLLIPTRIWDNVQMTSFFQNKQNQDLTETKLIRTIHTGSENNLSVTITALCSTGKAFRTSSHRGKYNYKLMQNSCSRFIQMTKHKKTTPVTWHSKKV